MIDSPDVESVVEWTVEWMTDILPTWLEPIDAPSRIPYRGGFARCNPLFPTA